ncbi:MAG TPA: LCP family protein [Anaerolineae bacterium]|nr:LCP family protein [Anaerolineae bacterium]HQK13460.1 LCP family protein [Anaerolineae bacterium]
MSKIQSVLLVCCCLVLILLLTILLFSIAQSVPQTPSVIYIVVTPTPMGISSTLMVPPSPKSSPTPTFYVPPTWTPTFTPSPMPTATPLPTRTPTPTQTPTPSITSSPLPPRRPTAIPITPIAELEITMTQAYSGYLPVPIPTAVPRYPIPEDAITIVLLGSDQRPDWDYWNTDAIQYVVIYPDIPSVAVLSIPRDLYVYIPNMRMSRINTADLYGERYGFDGGGIGLLNQTLLYNLGITADYYAMVNFDGLIGLVDVLGGVDVPVHCQLHDYWPIPDENGEYHILTLEPGIHHMNGELALWYSRTRKTTSVFAREARQQQILEAMWRKAKQSNLFTMLPALYEQTRDLYQTDLGLGNILELGIVAAQLDSTDVRFYNIGRNETQFYITGQGGNVYLPLWEPVSAVIDAAIKRPAESRATRAEIRIEVWNGTTLPDRDWLAADTLTRYGYTPVVTPADRQDYAQTQIVVFSSTTKGTGLNQIQQLFHVRDENVSYVENPASDVKLRLILGQDYDPCR